MNLFIVTPANNGDRESLLSNLPTTYHPVFKDDLGNDEQFEAYSKADILLGNAPLEWLEKKNDHLKWWQLESAGFQQYETLTLDFPTTNVGDYYAQPCAETIVGGIMALYRKIDTLAVLQSKKTWIGAPLRLEMKLLHRQKVVILGAGEIAMCVKKILAGFDCEIHLLAKTNPNATLHSAKELKAILPKMDVVISCLPGTAEGFFTKEMIGLMNSEAIFANVGRGNTVDEIALATALSTEKIAGAVLDVTNVEPLPQDNPLWTLPTVLLLQHTGGGRRNEHRGKFEIFLDNLSRFEAGTELKNRINLNRGY